MSRKKIGVEQVSAAVDAVIAAYPETSDKRVSRRLGGRYAEHGEPCCLVGVMLIQLGASVATLKDLDREDETIDDSAHPYWKRFTPEARALMNFLQRQNDGGASWEKAVETAFKVNRYWLENKRYGYYPERAFPGPWCTVDNARKFIGSKYSQFD